MITSTGPCGTPPFLTVAPAPAGFAGSAGVPGVPDRALSAPVLASRRKYGNEAMLGSGSVGWR